jgi:hypothetical protein
MAIQVQQGSSITLAATFRNINGFLENPSAPRVSIYPYGKRPGGTGVTELDSVVLDAVPTNVGLGGYEYTYEVPDEAQVGEWYALWEGEFGEASFVALTEFVVIDGSGSAASQYTGQPTLMQNNVYVLTLDGILSEDGDELSQTVVWFTSQYSPMHSTYENVLSILSRIFANVEEDAINYLIHKASLEADAVTMPRKQTCTTFRKSYPQTNNEFLALAKQKYVECAVAISAIGDVLGTSGLPKAKKLGDLRVEWQDNSRSLSDMLNKLFEKLDEWERVLNAGGDISVGESLGANWGIEGIFHPDRPDVGRRIREPIYSNVASNTKVRVYPHLRYQHDYQPPSNSVRRNEPWP